MGEAITGEPNRSRTGLSAQQELALARVHSVGELVSLLREHQRRRWQQHDLVPVESYLADFPLLASDGQAVADLVMNEMLLREENGRPPELEEYLLRLPAYAGVIELRFGMHRLLAGGPVKQDTDPGRPETRSDDRPPGSATAGRLPHIPTYVILRELGRGGMGVVYLARQQGLDRLVALKMILAGAQASVQEHQRFRDEAVAISRMQHPNLVQVYEVGDYEGVPYFSMEYVTGGGLNEKIHGKPQAPEHAAELVRQLAVGVHCAHLHGIVHRDLKPANVLLATKEESLTEGDGNAWWSLAVPKISDFGLAKSIGGHRQTRTGAIMGTPSYMAPEQAMGQSKAVGPAADIYALGAIFYELLTGRPPFVAESSWDTISQVIHQEPLPPSQLQPRLPCDLETICLKCLQKEPGNRFATAQELADDLQRFQEGRPIHSRPVALPERIWKWMKRRPALAALCFGSLLGLALFLAGGIYHHIYLREALTEAQDARQQSSERLLHLLVDNGVSNGERGHLLQALAWFIEAMHEDPDPARLEMHRLRLTTLLRECPQIEQMLFQDDLVRQAEFSPDESQIVTVSGVTAQLWDARSGQPSAPPLCHADKVLHVAFSPDGKCLASGSADQTAWVWEVGTGKKRLATPLRHQGAVNYVRFSPESTRLVTSGADGVAKVWEAATGKLMLELTHRGDVRSGVFNPAGDRLLTAGADGTGQLWDAASGERVGAALQHAGRVNYAEFSPDGRMAVTASADGTARVWSASSGEPLSPPVSHPGPIVSATFSPDSRRLATASVDGTARMWDALAGKLLTIMRHESAVHTVAFSRDGNRLVTASDDNSACIWDAQWGYRLGPPLWHNGSLHSARFSADGQRILTAAGSGTTRIWRVGQRIPGPRLQHDAPVTTATFGPDGRLVLTGTEDGRVQLWSASTGKPFGAALPHPAPIRSAQFSADGRQVVTVSGHSARIWDVASQRPVTPLLLTHRGPVRAAQFSPDGRYVASVSDDQTAQLWDAQTGAPLGQPLPHPQQVLGVAFSPNGRLLLTAGADGAARIWELDGERSVRHTLLHDGDVLKASFSPDGKRIVTASNDRTARVWDAATGQAVAPPMRHSSYVSQANFSPDGKRVVTASDDNTARIWDATTGQPLTPPLWQWGSVLRASFSPDGQYVVTASADNSARVWSAATGQPVSVLLRHNLPVTAAAFSPDGQSVITASQDRTARIWDLAPDRRPLKEMIAEAELLSSARIDATGGFVPLHKETVQQLWRQYQSQRRNEK